MGAEQLGDLRQPVDERVAVLAKEDVPRRIWAKDHTVWSDDPTEITDRLGWLDVHRRVDLDELRAFARGCDGFTNVGAPRHGPFFLTSAI